MHLYLPPPPRLTGQVCGGGDPRCIIMAVHRRRTPPPPRPRPPQTKVTIAGTNEIYRWEDLVGPFLVHKLLGPKPPAPPPPPPPLLLMLP